MRAQPRSGGNGQWPVDSCQRPKASGAGGLYPKALIVYKPPRQNSPEAFPRQTPWDKNEDSPASSCLGFWR